ncbi:MAG: M55 family metallopeptidase [bacterium]
MNKYLISVDAEGITGVINQNFARKDGKYYQLGCDYMTSDVNAVVQGILNVDVDAWIVVRDGHEDAVNLDLEKLHPRANLIQGWGPVQNMLAGLDQSFTGVFLVGYHASGKNNSAVLGHTLSSRVHYVKINGKFINETGIAALYAGSYNVPIAFISGDDCAVNEAREQLGDVVGVVVKQSFARDCAISLPLEQAQLLLERGAADAIVKLQQNHFPVFKVTAPTTLEIGFYNIGFKISVFQSLSEILSFDPAYRFDHEKFAITFSSSNVSEVLQRLNMLMFLVYGISVF